MKFLALEPGVRILICFILCLALGFAAGIRAGCTLRGWTESGARRLNHWQKVDATPDNALVSDRSGLRWISLCDVRDITFAAAPATKHFGHDGGTTGAARLSGSNSRVAPTDRDDGRGEASDV